MKKIALFALLFAIAQQAQAAKNDFVPYYMKNANSANSNVIKTDSANCGDDNCGDCNGGQLPSNVLATVQFISLQNETNRYAKQVSCGGCGDDNCGDDSIDMPIIK
jgi:hypothetical protein